MVQRLTFAMRVMIDLDIIESGSQYDHHHKCLKPLWDDDIKSGFASLNFCNDTVRIKRQLEKVKKREDISNELKQLHQKVLKKQRDKNEKSKNKQNFKNGGNSMNNRRKNGNNNNNNNTNKRNSRSKNQNNQTKNASKGNKKRGNRSRKSSRRKGNDVTIVHDKTDTLSINEKKLARGLMGLPTNPRKGKQKKSLQKPEGFDMEWIDECLNIGL